MKTAYFDAFSGLSGDMIVGAILECGADFADLYRAYGDVRADGSKLADGSKRKTVGASTYKPSRKQAQRKRKLSH